MDEVHSRSCLHSDEDKRDVGSCDWVHSKGLHTIGFHNGCVPVLRPGFAILYRLLVLLCPMSAASSVTSSLAQHQLSIKQFSWRRKNSPSYLRPNPSLSDTAIQSFFSNCALLRYGCKTRVLKHVRAVGKRSESLTPLCLALSRS